MRKSVLGFFLAFAAAMLVLGALELLNPPPAAAQEELCPNGQPKYFGRCPGDPSIRRTSQAECDAKKSACDVALQGMYDECISRRMVGCMDSCQNEYHFSRNECKYKMCSWTDISQNSRDFYINKCKSESEYIDKRSSCAADYSECVASIGG